MENISNRDELIILEKKREALEETVRIALNIERLHNGLEATLSMSESTANIPPHVLGTLEELDEETSLMPSNTLKEILGTLEKIVRSKLENILEISEMDERQLINAEAGKIEKLVNEFRKKAQTAIALRVLLHTRGEVTHPIILQVSTDQIHSQLNILNKKERGYRETIKSELINMISETERMLSAENLTNKMKMFLNISHQNLSDNLSHLDAGKSITAMPVTIEMIEMGEHGITSIDTTPIDTGQNNPPTIQKKSLYSPAQASILPPKEVQEREKPSDLFSRLKKWATTPDDTNRE